MSELFQSASKNQMKSVLHFPDIWHGRVSSLRGGQFHAIAAAWLAWKFTSDLLAQGVVAAVGRIPRDIFNATGSRIAGKIPEDQGSTLSLY